MSAEDWKPVGTALLGSWPTQVASWGAEGIAAFVAEIAARGVTPDQALVAIRCRSDRFPPSAGELVDEARKDPNRPLFAEMFRQVWGRGGVLRARPAYRDGEWDCTFEEAQRRRLAECHPVVQGFVGMMGLERLRMLEVDHEDYADLKRKELAQAYEQYCEATEHRAVHALAMARSGRGALGRTDPLAAIEGPRRALESRGE